MISIVSPIFNVPFFKAPPNTPPCRFSSFVPGLLMSKLRATRNNGFSSLAGFDVSMLHKTSRTLSMFTPCSAETGMIGAFSATVPFTNSLIALKFSTARSFETRSILFWTMIMFLIFFALSATRCSCVCGLIPSFAPTTRIAASMIAAPESIVAISISWPGASTNVMYLFGFPFASFSTDNFPPSSFTIASAYPSLIVIPLLSSSECVSAHLPDSLCRSVVFPWSMCPTIPTFIVSNFDMSSDGTNSSLQVASLEVVDFVVSFSMLIIKKVGF